MLAWYDGPLVALCLALLLPLGLLNWLYGRNALVLNGRLNDELEREVDVIGGGAAAEVHGHYRRVAGWRVKLSDQEALNFGLTDLLLLGLLAAALVRSAAALGGDVGHLLAVFRYVLMFVTGLGGVPLLVQQLGRLRDIARRVTTPCSGDASPGQAPTPPPPLCDQAPASFVAPVTNARAARFGGEGRGAAAGTAGAKGPGAGSRRRPAPGDLFKEPVMSKHVVEVVEVEGARPSAGSEGRAAYRAPELHEVGTLRHLRGHLGGRYRDSRPMSCFGYPPGS
jgi:hypothetical protein